MLKWYHWLSPAHQLLALHGRWVVSSVGAELKAQCGDQRFVNDVFYSPIAMKEIIEIDKVLRKSYRGKMRWFMGATFLLASLIRIDRIPLSEKERCLEMLMARHARILGGAKSGKLPQGLDNPDLRELENLMRIGFAVLEEERLVQA